MKSLPDGTLVTGVRCLPDGALVTGVHAAAHGTAVGPGEVARVGQRAQHADGARTVNRRPQVV